MILTDTVYVLDSLGVKAVIEKVGTFTWLKLDETDFYVMLILNGQRWYLGSAEYIDNYYCLLHHIVSAYAR